MPANLSPVYKEAEERYRQARTPEEKLACLEEMLRLIPKHKGTDKLQADLKSRMAKLRRLPKKKGGARGFSHHVPKEGAGQVALVGPPNVGKSSLVARLTHASPKIADYPFTTHETTPGMMPFEDIAFQLLDLPPLSDEHVEPWVYELIRVADLVWLVVDSSNSVDGVELVERLLAERKLGLRSPEESAELPSVGWAHQPTVLVVSGRDRPDSAENLAILRELLPRKWPIVSVSATDGAGCDELARTTFQALHIIRVYTKQPGKPADRDQPYTLPQGATVADLARKIHKDLLAQLKFARIWGAQVFDGQTVHSEHTLDEGDVIEIHA